MFGDSQEEFTGWRKCSRLTEMARVYWLNSCGRSGWSRNWHTASLEWGPRALLVHLTSDMRNSQGMKTTRRASTHMAHGKGLTVLSFSYCAQLPTCSFSHSKYRCLKTSLTNFIAVERSDWFARESHLRSPTPPRLYELECSSEAWCSQKYSAWSDTSFIRTSSCVICKRHPFLFLFLLMKVLTCVS